jgi:MSHA pilin protein MshC
MPDRTRCTASSTGYTLVELVLVIAILAVVAAFAAPRFFERSAFADRGYADAVAGALRIAQKSAVATGCRVRVTVDGGGYRARLPAAAGNGCDPLDATFPVPLPLPDGSAVEGPADAPVTPLPASFTFDAAGRVVGAAPALAVGPWRIDVDASTGDVAVVRP